MRILSIFALTLLTLPVTAHAQRHTSRASLYTSDLFSDDAVWNATVHEERPPRADDDPVRAPELVAHAEAEATLQPLQRMSIDQDVLRELIVDRGRQVAMRAVADALRGIGGPLANRQYVRDIVGQASRLTSGCSTPSFVSRTSASSDAARSTRAGGSTSLSSGCGPTRG